MESTRVSGVWCTCHRHRILFGEKHGIDTEKCRAKETEIPRCLSRTPYILYPTSHISRWCTGCGFQSVSETSGRRTQLQMGAKILSSYVMDTSQDLICDTQGDKRLSPCYKNKMEMPGNWRGCILCTKELIFISDKFSYITDANIDCGSISAIGNFLNYCSDFDPSAVSSFDVWIFSKHISYKLSVSFSIDRCSFGIYSFLYQINKLQLFRSLKKFFFSGLKEEMKIVMRKKVKTIRDFH